MEKLIKAFFVIVIILGLVILLNHNLQVRDRGICVLHQKMILERDKSGAKLSAVLLRPQCDWHGNFLVQQCDFATQTCWCVDQNGRPLRGTQTAKAQGQPKACSLSWLEQVLLEWQLHVKPMSGTSLKPMTKAVKQ